MFFEIRSHSAAQDGLEPAMYLVILMFYLLDPRIIGVSHHTHLVPTFLFSNFFNVTSPQNIFLAMKRNEVLTYMTTYIGPENSNTSN